MPQKWMSIFALSIQVMAALPRLIQTIRDIAKALDDDDPALKQVRDILDTTEVAIHELRAQMPELDSRQTDVEKLP